VIGRRQGTEKAAEPESIDWAQRCPAQSGQPEMVRHEAPVCGLVDPAGVIYCALNTPHRSMDTTPFPEADSPEQERFWLNSRIEIVALLTRLSRENVPMTLYWNHDGECAVTQILEANDDADELKLDMPGVARLRDGLLAAKELICVSFVDHIKVQFTVRSPKPAASGAYPAIQTAIPERVLRLQRREYYRVRTPETLSASCLVPYSGAQEKYESLRVLDLSVGGMAVLAYPRHFDLSESSIIDRCFLDLPGVGTVTVRMRVAHVEESADGATRRWGCEFIDLSAHARMMLQRYVQKIDVEQRKLQAKRRAA
jgi:flagellar brake protein